MINALLSNGLLAALTGLLVFTLPIVFVWQRVGTLGFFLDRIWRLAGGRTELDDTTLSMIDREHAQIEYFNYKYKLKAERLADIHRIHEFMTRHEVGLEHLCAVRQWFSLNPTPSLSTPSTSKRIVTIWGGGLLYLLMCAAFGALSFNSTYLRFNDTKGYFLTDGVTVSGAMFGEQKISLSDCPTIKLDASSDTLKDHMDILCKAHEQGEFKALVERSVFQQRIAFLYVAFLTAIGTFLCARYVHSARKAQQLVKRITASASADESEPSPTNPPSPIPGGAHQAPC
jgi:hypothetical protein